MVGTLCAGSQVHFTTFISFIKYKKMKNIWGDLLSWFFWFSLLLLLWICFQNQTFWLLLGGCIWVGKHHSMWEPVKYTFCLFSLASVGHDMFSMTVWEPAHFSEVLALGAGQWKECERKSGLRFCWCFSIGVNHINGFYYLCWDWNNWSHMKTHPNYISTDPRKCLF